MKRVLKESKSSNSLTKKTRKAPKEILESHDRYRKKARSTYEKKPIIKFKRYINGLDLESKRKKTDYAKKPEVQIRRKFCNSQRLTRNKILEHLAKNGELFTADGDNIGILGGCVVIEEKKEYYIIKKNGEYSLHPYEDEIFLLQQIPVDNTPDENEIEFERICKQFTDGDPAIIEMVRNKRTFTQVVNPNIDVESLQEKVKKRLEESSSSDTEESANGEQGTKS